MPEINDDELLLRIHGTVRKVVDMQMESGDPPETKEAYNRLMSQGYDEDHCYEMIGRCIVAEFRNLVGAQQFDYKRYVDSLNLLPKPFDQNS